MNKPSPYSSEKVWQEYLSQFIGKKATLKLALSVREKLKAKENPTPQLKNERLKIAIHNNNLKQVARSSAITANKRIQNWNYGANPCFSICRKGEYASINEGRYSRSCKFTKYSYDPVYTSYVTIAHSKNGLVYKRGFFGELKSSTIKAPKGMLFEIDSNGLLLRRKSDRMDFHLSGEMLERKNFATFVRAEMAKNFRLRLDAKRKEKKEKFLQKLFLRDLKTTMVTLNDSRKAGNCVEGSLQFAERRLKIPRQEILNGGYLYYICAEKLVKTGDERALRAAKVAWERETAVCI